MSQLSCRKHIFVVFVVWELLLPAWGQTGASRRPVAPDLLQGGELVVKSRSFAVGTPAGEWQWFLAESEGATPSRETYVCAEAATGAEFLVTVVDTRAPLDDKFMAGFTKGVEQSSTAAGCKIVSMRADKSAVPLPGSYRCEWHALLPDKGSVCGYSYVVRGDAVYVLQHATRDALEPATFAGFVRTFRLLHVPPLHTASGPLMIGYVLLVGLACGGAGVVNRISRRPVLNGGTIGIVLVLAGFVAVMVSGGYAGVVRGLSPEQLGEVMGRRTGEVLLPLVVAFLASRAFRRHRVRRQEGMQG